MKDLLDHLDNARWVRWYEDHGLILTWHGSDLINVLSPSRTGALDAFGHGLGDDRSTTLDAFARGVFTIEQIDAAMDRYIERLDEN